jgi:ABC-type nitrate/sulfonate/bicarbonate transport system substrate-binding protein
LQGVHYQGDLPTLIADRRGLFADHGLQVAVDYGRSGKNNLAQLRAGEVDLALMALTPIVIDRLQDGTPDEAGDPVVLANLAHSTRLNHVVTLKRSPGDPGRALRGARIGVMKATNAEFLWSLFAARHGLENGLVELVNMPTDQIPAALETGKIDAGVVWQPWTDRLRARFGRRLTVFQSSTVYTAKWVLATRRMFVRDHADVVRRVLRAYDAAIEQIHRAPAAALARYRDRAGGSAEDASVPDRVIYELSLDWSIVASLFEQSAWARRVGYGGDRFDPVDLLSPAPLRRIAPATVHLPNPPDQEARTER